MPKKRVDFNVDGSAIDSTAGYVAGFADEIKTDRYISSVVGYVQSELSERFGIALDLVAKAAPESFHHVYEWGRSYRDYSTVGSPNSRLWRLTQMGRGADRVVGYMFLPSHRPVPVRPELAEMGVKEGLHVFTWKAPIMEYGMRVTIKRLPATKVLVFTDNSTDEIRFEKGPFTFEAGTSPHGAPQQKGMFTSFFVNWWRTAGPQIYESELKPRIESGMPKPGRLAEVARKLRSRPKAFSVGLTYDGKKTFASARAAARKDMQKQAKELRSNTMQRRLDKYGY